MSSQAPYSAISQGPASVPMDQFGGAQQRIMPRPQGWCTPRRTKVIIAIVLLTILYIIFIIAYASLKAKAEEKQRYGFSFE